MVWTQPSYEGQDFRTKVPPKTASFEQSWPSLALIYPDKITRSRLLTQRKKPQKYRKRQCLFLLSEQLYSLFAQAAVIASLITITHYLRFIKIET